MTAQFKELMQQTNPRKVINDLIHEATGYTMQVYEVNGVRTFGERVEVFDKEKFAKLIVRECIAQAVKEEERYDSMAGRDCEYCSMAMAMANFQGVLTEHFGVEE